MMIKVILCPDRVRRITGTFRFVEHRFLKEGLFFILTHCELLLYLFLVLVADRYGLSLYSYDKMCTLLRISVDEFILARDGLIEKDLIAFDGHTFQALSLTRHRTQSSRLELQECFSNLDAWIRRRSCMYHWQ
jgi:hypothetical protein